MTETTTGSQVPDFEAAKTSDRKAWATTGAALLGALAMTSCCILPLLLVSLGVTGVFIGKLGALYQYHWYFLAVAATALAFGFWKAYRPVPADKCADGACARPMNRKLMRSILWVAAVIVVIATAFPYFATTILSPF